VNSRKAQTLHAASDFKQQNWNLTKYLCDDTSKNTFKMALKIKRQIQYQENFGGTSLHQFVTGSFQLLCIVEFDAFRP